MILRPFDRFYLDARGRSSAMRRDVRDVQIDLRNVRGARRTLRVIETTVLLLTGFRHIRRENV